MKLFRSVVFWMHLALGYAAGLVILAMAVTGIALAFERQINAWADAPTVLQIRTDPSRAAELDSVLAVLRSDGQGVPTELVLHSDRRAPLEVRFGRERKLLLNPWTGEVIGQPPATRPRLP